MYHIKIDTIINFNTMKNFFKKRFVNIEDIDELCIQFDCSEEDLKDCLEQLSKECETFHYHIHEVDMGGFFIETVEWINGIKTGKNQYRPLE